MDKNNALKLHALARLLRIAALPHPSFSRFKINSAKTLLDYNCHRNLIP